MDKETNELLNALIKELDRVEQKYMADFLKLIIK